MVATPFTGFPHERWMGEITAITRAAQTKKEQDVSRTHVSIEVSPQVLGNAGSPGAVKHRQEAAVTRQEELVFHVRSGSLWCRARPSVHIRGGERLVNVRYYTRLHTCLGRWEEKRVRIGNLKTRQPPANPPPGYQPLST